jgi:type IV pilus assembly protein PilB
LSSPALPLASETQEPLLSKLGASKSDPERKQIALSLLRQRQGPGSDALRLAGYANIDALAESVANQLKLPRLQLDEVEIAPALINLLPRATVERHWIVPVFSSDGEITFATSDPSRLELFDWLGRELKSQILIVVATSSEVRGAIQRLYEPVLPAGAGLRSELGDEVSAEALKEATGIFDHLVARGSELGASDIHIEATEKGTCIRFRIDGVLRVLDDLPVDSHAALVSRVKILAQLDISERQAPQDGRIKMKLGDRPIDLRVSVLPTIFGEKVCCRILDNTKACLPLAELGFEAQQLETFQKMIRVPYGLLLVTGPTGSGKSTTLYGALNTVRSPELNIVSVEDPVEYQLPGINQVQVNTKRGLTFAGALRSILRQDPNVVLIGEIRDRETGIIAAEAALTGHLVMASMHTNDAASAITRLTEMGIEPFLVAPSLIGVIAQRLIRKICLDCKETYAPTESELLGLGLPAVPVGTLFSRGKGCATCQRTGYRGRTAVREILEIDETLRQQIGRGETAEDLRKTASAAGFRSMRFQALRRLFEGITTAPEVIRITRG